MAAGWFGVTGPGHVERGLEAQAHQRVERFVWDLHAAGTRHPWPQRLRRGEACRAAARLLAAGAQVRCERDGFTGGDIRLPQGRPAASRIEGQPAADRVAMPPQELGHLLAGLGLTPGQSVEHLQAGRLVPVGVAREPWRERLSRFAHGWHRRAHELPSKPGA
jgi:hypothetical protein